MLPFGAVAATEEAGRSGRAASAAGESALGLERWATLRAEIDAGTPQREVLEREDVAERDWLGAQAYWLKTMADEARRNKFGTTIRYQAIYNAKKKNFENRLERNRQKRERAPRIVPETGALDHAGEVLAAPLGAEIAPHPFPQPPPAPPRAPWTPPPVAPPGRAGFVSPHEDPSGPSTARDASSRAGAATPFGLAPPEPAMLGRVAPPAYGSGFPTPPPAPVAPPPVRFDAPPASLAPATLPPNTLPPITQPPATEPQAPAGPAPRQPRPTMSIDLDSPEMRDARAKAMPFSGASAAPKPPDPAPAAPRRDLGSTWSGGPPSAAAPATPFHAAGARPAPSPDPSAAPDLGAGLPFQRQVGSKSTPSFPAVVPPTPGQLETTPITQGEQRALRDALGVGPKPAAAKPATVNLGSTIASFDGTGSPRDATPFHPSATPQPPPPARKSEPTAVHDDDDDDDVPRTNILDPSVVAQALASATPFAHGTAQPAPVPAPAPAPPPKGGKSEPPAKTVTFDVSQIPAHLRQNLPFGGASGPPTTQLPQPTPPQQPPRNLSPAQPMPAVQPPPPSTRGGAGPGRMRFTINVFASLTAEIAENPGEIESIRQRYGISEAEHHEESQRWTEEFQKSEDLRARYLGIVQRYRGYVQQRKR